MAVPTVAIIGRPNVGKSSLLNALAGSMISIVEPTPGITRDRVSVMVRYGDTHIEMLDTGGYGIVDKEALSDQIESQIDVAIRSADLILFVVDIREGITPLENKIARLLRKHNPNVMVIANKADKASLFPRAAEFVRLGFGEALCVSATSNLNKSKMMDAVIERLKHIEWENPQEAIMKLAIVGKRNAGKSSFVNSIVGQERMIVSEIAGTTRDAVDIRFERDGQTFIAIDTAGIYKKNKMKENVEYYSYTRATKSITRADVVLFMIDATLPISQVDKKLAKFISDEFKPCILVVNKWDLVKDDADTDDYADYLSEVLPGLRYAPIAFTTAKDGKNLQSTLDLATELYKQSICEIPTSILNKAMDEIKNEKVGTAKKGGFPRIYYATQVGVQPISLLVFVNRPDYFDENYQRFMINRLRDLLPVSEVPIRLMFRKHNENRGL
ncbi:MAG: ribosome biogenesis GTPase Der [Sedimentisphaeraceae bacterium JB056]